MGYSPRGHKELGTTEQLTNTFTASLMEYLILLLLFFLLGKLRQFKFSIVISSYFILFF